MYRLITVSLLFLQIIHWHLSLGNTDTFSDAIHTISSPTQVTEPELAYRKENWALVDFAPVPKFSIDIHDPASALSGVEPWDPYIWERILALTRTDDGDEKGYFIDVGAKLGYTTLMTASLGYRVVSFEPMSRNAKKLARSVERNQGFSDRVKLYQNAVGAIHGQKVSLTENQENGEVTNVSQPSNNNTSQEVYGVDFVHEVTLSDVLLFLPHMPIDAHIVKVDVEGMEGSVLLGARDWICSQTVKHILIEFSEATRTNKAAPATEMFAFMQRAGYNVSDVNVHSNDTLIDYDMLVMGNFTGLPQNLLFSLQHNSTQNTNHCY